MFGVIGSLVGGALARRSARKDARRAEQRADPAAIRQRYEAAGFNPLLGLHEAAANPGMASYALSNDILMNSLAAAGDGFGEAATLRMQNTRLEKEKQRLDDLVQEATLGASVGGIYDASAPSDRPRSATGGGVPAEQPRRQAGERPSVPAGPSDSVSSDGGDTSRDSGGRTPADLVTVGPERGGPATRLPAAEIYDAGRTGYEWLGIDVEPWSGFSDAELVEQRNGEPSEIEQLFSGPFRRLVDLGNTGGRYLDDRRWGRLFDEAVENRYRQAWEIDAYDAWQRNRGGPVGNPF